MSEKLTSSAGDTLREAIVAALREIDQRLSSVHPGEADVHLARRAAKRARALARLAPADLATLARQTRRHVGEARRMLGGARDAQVRRATLARLRPRLHGADATLAEIIADPAGQERPIDTESVRASISALVRDWTLCDPSSDLTAITNAAARAYRKARRRWADAKHGGSNDLHRWRSAIVALEYHADFLSGFAPALREFRADADRLREYLGDINDLDELAEFARARRGDSEDRLQAVRALEEASAARRAKLLAKAFRLAENMLARTPAHWARSVRRSCGP